MKNSKNDDAQAENAPESKVTVDTSKTPIYYTNSVFVASDDLGVVLDFAQRIGPTNDQNIVARVGMSAEHAKRLVKTLNENLERYER